jgi:hypothetical protein
LLAGQNALAGSFMDKFIDPNDGKLDASDWLLEDRMFLPVPILITEPAVGYGAGAALVFFHELNKPDHGQPGQDRKGAGKRLPPSASAVFGGATENGTWFAGGGHQGSYKGDSLRYTGALFYPSVNLKFYGGGNSPLLKDGLEYNLAGWATIQKFLFRLGESPFLVGPQLTYFGATSTFEQLAPIPGIGPWELETENLGFGITTVYDTRDNLFSPLKGWQVEFTATTHSSESAIESDYTYVDFHPRGYWELNDTWGAAWRFQGEFTSGTAPFYALPDITLRGIPAMRYQGKTALVTEAQVDWKVNHRWTLLAFSGVGTTASSISSANDEPNHWAGGFGFRYLTARLLGLRAGLDIAVGPEQAAVYIQVGNAWNY